MSETNVAEVQNNETPANAKQVNRENHVLTLNEFTEGNNKGFKFWTIQFKNLPAAISHFTLNSVSCPLFKVPEVGSLHFFRENLHVCSIFRHKLG